MLPVIFTSSRAGDLFRIGRKLLLNKHLHPAETGLEEDIQITVEEEGGVEEVGRACACARVPDQVRRKELENR